jgi:hypothetical protein
MVCGALTGSVRGRKREWLCVAASGSHSHRAALPAQVLEAEESEADKMAKSRGKVDTFSTPITSYLKGHDKD